MERKLAASTSLHALDITSHSSPIHSLDSPFSALSKSLSSKYLFGRRSRSTLKHSSTTIASSVASPLSNVSTLPSRSDSTPKRTDSLSNLAAGTLNQLDRDNALKPSVTIASALPTTNSSFSISSPAIKYSNTFRTSGVSLITSTFRKFRARRTEARHVNGDVVADEGGASNTNVDDTVTTPSLPAFQALSPFSQPTHPTALSTPQSMSTMSQFITPGHALRSAYSDSTMHLHSEREPVPRFTRHQGSSSASLAEVAVVYPRSAKSPSPKKGPTQSTQKRDSEGGLGIVGLLYCANQGKYSIIGGLVVDDKATPEEFVTTVELDTDGMEGGESEEEDEEIMIDAGIVILRESKVKPTPSPKKMLRRVPPPQFEELAVPKDTPQSPLRTGPHLTVASHPMVREKHTGSATESAASSGSGTEAGASGRSRSGAHSAFGSEHSQARVDGVDYGDATGILGIPFPDGEEGNASNYISLGTPLSQGTSLPASLSKQASPSNGMTSTSLHSPPLLGLGHPVSRPKHPQVFHASSPFFSLQKRTQSMMGLFARSTPGSCSPSASSTGSSTGMKKSPTGLGMLGRRGKKERKEQGDVLLDYAQVASLMELKDE